MHDERGIPEQASAEAEHRAVGTLIRLMGGCAELRDLAGEVVTYLRGWSGCEAVGLRLRDGDDYPYYETRGFPEPFVLLESRLCARAPDGGALLGEDGRPYLECMCGNILRGRVDPSMPFFTSGGSFWSNCTTALLAGTTEADRGAHTRNRCNAAGYESVALVPVRRGHEVLGLLQFNDHRRDRFSAELIAVFERFGECVGVALGEKLAQNRLREGEERLHSLFAGSPSGIIELAADGRVLSANPAACRMLGRSEGELMLSSRSDLADQEDPRAAAALEERARTGTFAGRLRYRRKDGTTFEAEVSSASYRTRAGERRAWVIFTDIDPLVRAEAALRAAMERNEWLARDAYHRVKNNLMAVESLLALQEGSLRDAADLGPFRDARSRIRAMLLIHESLHRSADLEFVGLRPYLQRLVRELAEAYRSPRAEVAVSLEADELDLGPEAALCVGLIVNELVANAFKHAFRGRAGGRVTVCLRREGGDLALLVEDDGVGLPPGLSVAGMASLGLRIVEGKTRELGGRLRLGGGPGGRFEIRFPAPA